MSNIKIQRPGLLLSGESIGLLPAADLERSKDVATLKGPSTAALRRRSQQATVGGWLKSARQSGSSDGLRVSVI